VRRRRPSCRRHALDHLLGALVVLVLVRPSAGGDGLMGVRTVARSGVGGVRAVESLSYQVRVWEIRAYTRRDGESFQVRWLVGDGVHQEVFRYFGLARSFQARLISAASVGEAFDVGTGLPVSMLPREPDEVSWYDFACAYMDAKWLWAAAGSRRNIAESLATATLALLDWGPGHPGRAQVHRALSSWAFNPGARADSPTPEADEVIAWVREACFPLLSLADADVLRGVLTAYAHRLDGAAASPATAARKRVTLFNVLGYAVEKGYFAVNPLLTLSHVSTAPAVTDAVDPRRVVTEVQGRRLVAAAGRQGEMGLHLKAFFGCMFLAALRPAEAGALTLDEIDLPDPGDEQAWGWFCLDHSIPQTQARWTDPDSREIRPLKQRPAGAVRRVPVCPPLARMLRQHLDLFGTAPDGRLFRSESGGLVDDNAYLRVYARARREVLSDTELRCGLAETPYDLRHARLSIWLAAGVPAAQVAEWAGNSVTVLLRVYAACLTDTADTSLQLLGRTPPPRPATDATSTDFLDLDAVQDLLTTRHSTWFQLATAYIDAKWPTVAEASRPNLIEVLTKVTLALLPDSPDQPPQLCLREALNRWAYRPDQRAAAPTQDQAVITWIKNHSPTCATLTHPDRLTAVLNALAHRNDGRPCTASVTARRHSALHNILEYAVHKRLLTVNPLPFRDWDSQLD
jgi:integrase